MTESKQTADGVKKGSKIQITNDSLKDQKKYSILAGPPCKLLFIAQNINHSSDLNSRLDLKLVRKKIIRHNGKSL